MKPTSDVPGRDVPIRRARVILIAVGVLCTLCAVAGLLYNSNTFRVIWARKNENPSFLIAFLTMSGISVACYMGLLFGGIAHIRGRMKYIWLVVGILFFEVVYTFVIGTIWALAPQGHGEAIARATGVANGAHTFQFIILLPLWAPPMLFYARAIAKRRP